MEGLRDKQDWGARCEIPRELIKSKTKHHLKEDQSCIQQDKGIGKGLSK